VVRRLTNGKTRLESISDLPFEGLLMHVAGQGKEGFYIVDVFESQEAVDRFNEAMVRSRKRSVSKSHPSSSRHTLYLGLTRSLPGGSSSTDRTPPVRSSSRPSWIALSLATSPRPLMIHLR
jgi:hypothetical protein